MEAIAHGVPPLRISVLFDGEDTAHVAVGEYERGNHNEKKGDGFAGVNPVESQ